ncbi:MAG: sortase [Candidatus Wildermuthbacteria bacterium]|nr:sortase [Candidatus Wildermuthbacteria bacterium]
MQRKTWENLLYVFEEEWVKYVKWGLIIVVGVFGLIYFKLWLAQQPVPGITVASGFESSEFAENSSAVPQTPIDIENLQAVLQVDALGINAPIVFVQSTNPKAFVDPLNRGVAHYPSAVPGQEGTSIILGHSAPLGIGSTYKKIFSKLNVLKPGDPVRVLVNGEVQEYAVTTTYLLQRGEQIPSYALETDRPRVLLITCWPPGVDRQRFVVQADSTQSKYTSN